MTCTTPSVHSTSRRLVGATAALALALLGGCRRSTEPEQGVAPPPVPSARVGLCKSGGGAVTDAASRAFFPRQVAGYCIDPNGETRAYGADATAPIDQVCLEQFDGECEIYKGFGLDRVVTLRYVDGGGTTGEVSVSLARTVYPVTKGIRLVGVTVSKLCTTSTTQQLELGLERPPG